ncbi:MAG: 6-pyruvoyl tetrahydropterin synthase family protein [Acetobacteraceae bacterium]
MLETFVEFTFEAAHQIPPFSTLHGHSFRVMVYLIGERDPVFGWSHNLYDVEPVVEDVKRQLNERYLNDIDGLSVPTLENVAAWIWDRLDGRLSGLDRIVVRRGIDGAGEGCCYSARLRRNAA